MQRLEFKDGIFSVKVNGRELDRALRGNVKIVTRDYVIYDRKWLEDNLDYEIDLIKNHQENRDRIKPFDKKDLDKYIDGYKDEKCEMCDKKDTCALYKARKKEYERAIDKLNEVGNPNPISFEELKKALKE